MRGTSVRALMVMLAMVASWSAAEEAPAPTTAPTTQTSADYGHSILSAGEATVLRTIARANEDRPRNAHVQVTVEGTVSTFRPAGSGRVIRFYFKEADEVGRDGFYCAYFPANGLFKEMEKKFGGTDGADLLNRRIRVTGVVVTYLGRPQMVITSASQVEAVQ